MRDPVTIERLALTGGTPEGGVVGRDGSIDRLETGLAGLLVSYR